MDTNVIEREVSQFFEPIEEKGFNGDIAIEFQVTSDRSIIGNMLMLSSLKERQGYALFKLDESVQKGFVVYTNPESIDSFEVDEGIWRELFCTLEFASCVMQGLTVKINKSLLGNSLEGLAAFLKERCPFVSIKPLQDSVDFIFSETLTLSRFQAFTDLAISIALNARRLQGRKDTIYIQHLLGLRWLLGLGRESIKELQGLIDFEAL